MNKNWKTTSLRCYYFSVIVISTTEVSAPVLHIDTFLLVVSLTWSFLLALQRLVLTFHAKACVKLTLSIRRMPQYQ